MIQIKNMKMPKDCRNCPFTAYIQPEEYHCLITNQNIWFVPKGERDLICPMQEVQEVKADDVCPDTLELMDPQLPETVTEKEPNIKVNYLKEDFRALCDDCSNKRACKWHRMFSAYSLRYIETCDGHKNENTEEE